VEDKLKLAYDRRKFTEEGEALPYYGNTVISFMNNENSGIYNLAKELQEAFKTTTYSYKLTFLPLPSIHMTVFSLCREIDRYTHYWPDHLNQNADFKEIDQEMYRRVHSVPKFESVKMKIDKVTITSISISPADEKSESTLRNYRNELSRETGIKHEGHNQYQFHITLAYLTKSLTDKEKEEARALCEKMTKYAKEYIQEPIGVPEPQFTIFNNMLAYSTNLEDRGELH